jgi:adenylate cyclase
LGVRYLLDGAVRRAGGRVRISVSLIDARDGVQLWADRFDGDMADIFGLQDQVSLSAAARIEPQVQAEEIRRAHAKPAANLGAYDLFLRAVALSNTISPEGIRQALPLYERCLELEPNNVRVLTSCAARLANLAILGNTDVDQLRALARERMQAALRLAPDDPWVLAGAAAILLDLGEDLAMARELADQAIAANPGFAGAWRASGFVRALSGDPDTAVEHLEHCMRLDPLSPSRSGTLTGLAMARLAQRRFEDAIALFRQSAQLSSSYPTNYLYLAACYSHLKQFAEASEAAARFRATSGTDVREFAHRLRGWDWMVSRLSRIPDA